MHYKAEAKAKVLSFYLRNEVKFRTQALLRKGAVQKETLQNTTMRNVATNRCCAGGLHQITSSSNYRCRTKVKGILRHKGITVAFLGA